jgi:hypothetical protein
MSSLLWPSGAPRLPLPLPCLLLPALSAQACYAAPRWTCARQRGTSLLLPPRVVAESRKTGGWVPWRPASTWQLEVGPCPDPAVIASLARRLVGLPPARHTYILAVHLCGVPRP